MTRTKFSRQAARCPVVLAFLLASTALGGTTWHVDDSALVNGHGRSWNRAFRSLHDGLAAANPGDVIKVGQGWYRPAGANGDRVRTFMVPDGITLQGGFAGYGATNPNSCRPAQFKTILSGDLNGNDGPDFIGTGENALHVVTLNKVGPQTVLRGIYIEGGNANREVLVGGVLSPDAFGGGVLLLGSASPTIRECTIRRNQAIVNGGGLYAGSLTAVPRLISCTLRDNLARDSSGGAAVRKGRFVNCMFHGNRAGYFVGGLFGNQITVTRCTFRDNTFGGALGGSNSTFSECRFIDNEASRGGGLFVHGDNIGIVNCDFESNTASDRGGGLFVQDGSNVIMHNCAFYGNGAAYEGHGMLNRGHVLAVNCLFSGNGMQGANTGAVSSLWGTCELVNCTISGTDNPGFPGAGVHAIELVMRNCIVWGNTGIGDVQQSQVHVTTGAILIEHCCIEGWDGSYGGMGNSGGDPQFNDPDGADNVLGTTDDSLRLGGSSSAIDAGHAFHLPQDGFDLDHDGIRNEAVPVDLDLTPRVQGATIDLGAFEN